MKWLNITIFGLGIIIAIALGYFFYYLSSRRKIAWIIGPIVLLCSILSFCLYWYKENRPPIIISPPKFKSAANFDYVEKFKVQNRSNTVFYQIWIKFLSNSDNFDWSNFKIELLDEPDQYLSLETMKISSFIYMIRGKNNEGLEFRYLVLDHLDNDRKYEFDVEIKNKESNKESIIYPKLISYSMEPNLKGKNKDGWSVLSFNPPENFTMCGLSVLFRKK